jgi:Excalibur calcium-binding domain
MMKRLLTIPLLLLVSTLFAPKALALRCSDFQYWEDAQGHPELDRDGDGSACESLPRRGSTAPSRPAQPSSRPSRPAQERVSDDLGTIISAGEDTEIYRIAASLPRGSYRYTTTSGGEQYRGTIQLTSRAIDDSGNITATGSFSDSANSGNGCLGRFKIVYFPSADQFTAVWYVDGTASGTCAAVGKTFELQEMQMVL